MDRVKHFLTQTTSLFGKNNMSKTIVIFTPGQPTAPSQVQTLPFPCFPYFKEQPYIRGPELETPESDLIPHSLHSVGHMEDHIPSP